MGRNGEILALVLITLIAFTSPSPLIVKLSSAQTVPKPLVPEFTIRPVGPSFDIPPTYSFNSSSGLFYVNEGYHFEYSTVEIIIKNQAFPNQTDIDHLFYNVRLKPHNYPDSYWNELFKPNWNGFPVQTSSNFTIIPIAAEGATELQYQIPTGATTDIQVEAMIGHIGRNNTITPYPYPYVFFGETSGWSSTQTINLPPKEPIFVSSPTPSPIVTAPANRNAPHLEPIDYLVPIVAILAIIVGTLILFYRWHRNQSRKLA